MSSDNKFLKYKCRVLAVNTGNTEDVLTSPITVPAYRGYKTGETLPAGTKLIDIIRKEFETPVPTHKITISVVGQGITSPSGTQEIVEGENFILTSATPDAGWKLKNVTLDGRVVTLPNTIPSVAAAHTYVVTFEETNSFTITGVAGEHGTISPTDAGSYEEGTAVEAKTFTATPETGYVVDKWFVNNVEQSETGNTFTLPAITAIDKNYEVKVTFKYNMYSVTVTDNTPSTLTNYGTIFPGKGESKYTAGQELTISATPNTGFKVKTFTVNGSAVTGTTYTLRGNEIEANAVNEVVVEFEEAPVEVYHVTVEDTTTGLTNYGTIVPAAQTAPYDYEVGTDSSVVATPNAGFKIKSFKVDGVEQTISDPTKAFTHHITGIAKDVTVAVSVEFEEVQLKFVQAYIPDSDDSGDLRVPTEANMVVKARLDKSQAEIDAIVATKEFVTPMYEDAWAEDMEHLYEYVFCFPATMTQPDSVIDMNGDPEDWKHINLTFEGEEYVAWYSNFCSCGTQSKFLWN